MQLGVKEGQVKTIVTTPVVIGPLLVMVTVPSHAVPTTPLGPVLEVEGEKTQVNGLDGLVELTLCEVEVTSEGLVSFIVMCSYPAGISKRYKSPEH